jgi:hypothetical protein
MIPHNFLDAINGTLNSSSLVTHRIHDSISRRRADHIDAAPLTAPDGAHSSLIFIP